MLINMISSASWTNTCLSLCLSVPKDTFHRQATGFAGPSLCPSVSVSVCLSLSLSASLCVSLSVCLSVCLSVSLCLCLCLCLSRSLSLSLSVSRRKPLPRRNIFFYRSLSLSFCLSLCLILQVLLFVFLSLCLSVCLGLAQRVADCQVCRYLWQVQPVDSNSVSEFRAMNSRNKVLLTSSPILHMEWQTAKFEQPINVSLFSLSLSLSVSVSVCLSPTHTYTHAQSINLLNPGDAAWLGITRVRAAKQLHTQTIYGSLHIGPAQMTGFRTWLCSLPNPLDMIQMLPDYTHTCESRGGRPGLSVLMSLTVSVDVKQHWTVHTHWSQFVPNSQPDIIIIIIVMDFFLAPI